MCENITILFCILMEIYRTNFNCEFDDMSEGENLYAEALAHLLDVDTADYIEFLNDDEDSSFNIAADYDAPYGDY